MKNAEAEIAELRELLEAMTRDPTVTPSDPNSNYNYICGTCGAIRTYMGEGFPHKEGCALVKAKKWLADNPPLKEA